MRVYNTALVLPAATSVRLFDVRGSLCGCLWVSSSTAAAGRESAAVRGSARWGHVSCAATGYAAAHAEFAAEEEGGRVPVAQHALANDDVDVGLRLAEQVLAPVQRLAVIERHAKDVHVPATERRGWSQRQPPTGLHHASTQHGTTRVGARAKAAVRAPRARYWLIVYGRALNEGGSGR